MQTRLKNKLAECLTARDLKKSQLAFRFNLSRAHVTRLVRGDVHPSIGLALGLAKFFHLPVESIFQLDDEGTNPPPTISPVPGRGQGTPNKAGNNKCKE